MKKIIFFTGFCYLAACLIACMNNHSSNNFNNTPIEEVLVEPKENNNTNSQNIPPIQSEETVNIIDTLNATNISGTIYYKNTTIKNVKSEYTHYSAEDYLNEIKSEKTTAELLKEIDEELKYYRALKYTYPSIQNTSTIYDNPPSQTGYDPASINPNSNPNTVDVKGYFKSNGTYVEPYTRTAPNNTIIDNFNYLK